MILCRTCGHSNADDATFCASCKSFLEFSGERLEATAAAAPGVGARGPEVVPPTTSEIAPAASGAGGSRPSGSASPSETFEASKALCPSCGTANEIGRVFCRFCGERLTASVPVGAAPARRQLRLTQSRVLLGGVTAVAVLAIGAAVALGVGGQRPSPTGAPPIATSAASPPPQPSPGASVASAASGTPALASAIPSSPSGTAAPGPSAAALAPASQASPGPVPSPTAVVTAVPSPSPAPIAFYALIAGRVDLYLISPNGGPPSRITADSQPDSDPKWSPDGTRLVFDSRRADGRRNIWVLEPGGAFTRLTADSGSNNSFATWSPDGASIAWSHDGQIWTMNSHDGRDPKQLTAGPGDTRPSWSRRGVIAFQRPTQGGPEIWTVAADGSSPAQALIDTAAGGGDQPSWSPDGSQIAFRRGVAGVDRIWVAAADGVSGLMDVTPGEGCPCQYPTWSPDGASLALQVGSTPHQQIAVVPAGGGAIRRLTDNSGENLVPGWAT